MSENKVDVEKLLSKNTWQEERKKLRSLALDNGLDEAVKWGKLCYTYEGSNVVIIFGLKNYCALGFFKGSLLADDDDVLIQPGKHSQAMRQIRFTGLDEITDREDIVVRYIKKAIQAEKDGLEVDFDEKDNLVYPDELQTRMNDDPAFAEAFDKLTPGRQRGYVLHFANARQSGTRTSRIEKCRSRIMQAKGLNER